MLSIEASAEVWRKLASLPERPSHTSVSAACPKTATRAIRAVWGDDPAAHQVALLTIERGGHAEPSPSRRYPNLFKRFPGRQHAGVEIAEEAWAFFSTKRASAT